MEEVKQAVALEAAVLAREENGPSNPTETTGTALDEPINGAEDFACTNFGSDYLLQDADEVAAEVQVLLAAASVGSAGQRTLGSGRR